MSLPLITASATASATSSYRYISPSWVEQGGYRVNSLTHGYACWRPSQTGPIVGAIFGGIAIGLLIASWIALFIAWRRARARSRRAVRDLEQTVGREGFNSEDFYTPNLDDSKDKLPLLFDYERDGDGGRMRTL
ncbi:hypothetical protein BDZ89DRAFT_1083019, partial [Hymenopellis radicata]